MSSHAGSRAPRAVAVAVAVACAVASAAGPSSAPAAEARSSGAVAGAPGIGDPYFPLQGNGGYDVEHYDIALTYQPSTQHLVATTTVVATATSSLERFDLDFRGPHVTAVRVDGRTAAFTRQGQELVVTPARVLRAGHRFTVAVDYAGRPQPVTDPDGSIEGWVATDDGAFVPGEPQGAPSWFPCNDHPTDKATFTVSARVPEGVVAVGNGELASERTHDGWTTFVWRERRPMATYLATITLGRFTVTRSRAVGVPSYVALDPRTAKASAAAVAALPEILEFFRSVFGPYPFRAAGAVVDDAPKVGYALETQTRPIFDRAPDVSTMAHELAHQWYGDSVSLRRWSDIWLNEGFATYAEWLWSEHTGGPTAEAIFASKGYYGRPATAPVWQTVTADPGPKGLFGDAPYARGAMTLQALRGKVGDAAFFRILHGWASRHRYGNASTEDFVALAERVSGRDLGHFFDVWLYEKGKPTSW